MMKLQVKRFPGIKPRCPCIACGQHTEWVAYTALSKYSKKPEPAWPFAHFCCANRVAIKHVEEYLKLRGREAELYSLNLQKPFLTKGCVICKGSGEEACWCTRADKPCNDGPMSCGSTRKRICSICRGMGKIRP